MRSRDIPSMEEALGDELEIREAQKDQRLKASVFISAAERKIIADAAWHRGMTVNSYLRRAALAFSAYDLGLDWWEVTANETHIGGKSSGRTSYERLHGSGYGDWIISGLHS